MDSKPQQEEVFEVSPEFLVEEPEQVHVYNSFHNDSFAKEEIVTNKLPYTLQDTQDVVNI